ncbi:hypothetical protein L9F63_003393 [Diploptera punctata]|uniref:Protein lifeguard 1 n=1 Tax=Diploptera punctata TaxID=6984 RepID=A0AAD7ZK74_DIPPU|nr:hypothetical protein L9F63_003393 [Diploptera punctata]
MLVTIKAHRQSLVCILSGSNYQNFYGQPGYPPQSGYPPQGGYPPQSGYPAPQGPGYPPPYTSSPGFVPPPAGVPYSQPAANPYTTPNQAMYGSSYGGDEPLTERVENFEFSDKSIRRGFIRKVYGILMVQLSISLGFIAWFTFHIPTKQYVQHHTGLWWAAFAIMIVCLITMACCGDVRRKAPMNFIFLFIFTLAESFMLGLASSTYDTDAVLMAVGICAAVCFGLTLFAFQTKWDFTIMGGALCAAVIVLMLFGILAIFIQGKTITLIYASCGALIFSLYLVYDTQLMMGGKHKYSISPEEYIFAALNLYLDIVNIFLYILTIIGASRD